MDWLKELFHNSTFVFFGLVIGVPVIMMSLTEIVKLLIKHRERMAMIEHGMDPYAHDRRPRTSKLASEDPAPAPDPSK